MAPSAAGNLIPFPFSKAASLLLYFFLYVALVTLTLFKSAFDIRKQRTERKQNTQELKLLHSKPSETGLNAQLGAALSQIINKGKSENEESDTNSHRQRTRRRRRKETTGKVEVLLDMTRAGIQALDRWTKSDNETS